MTLPFYALAIFFAALHAFITAYINSTVAIQAAGPGGMLVTFLGGSLIALIGFYCAPMTLSRFGNRRLLTFASGAGLLALIALASGALPAWGILLALMVHIASAPLIGYSLDIFFERSNTTASVTGFARGIFLTSANTALVLAPLLSGLLLEDFGSQMVYSLSALCLALFLSLMLLKSRTFTDPVYLSVSLPHMGRIAAGPLGPVMLAHFTLRVFYGWAPVYLPLYLTLVLGFPWSEAGLILAVALLPFALFELPAGKIADSYLGEREVMAFGFIVLACAIAALWLVPAKTLVVLAIIMFMTRAGAALIEISTETNFFRQVGAEHADAIVLFRMLGPIGWITGISLAALTIALLPMPYAFGVLAVLAFLGLIPALRIHDSK